MLDSAEILPVPGIKLASVRSGIRYPDRRDLVLIEVTPACRCAAVFTRNAFQAAPVVVARQHLATTNPRYLLINTGYANAGTGQQGLVDAQASCEAVAKLTGCLPYEVLPFSTGVIGEPLPVDRVVASLPAAVQGLNSDNWLEAAHGIMTTDTRPKIASLRDTIGGQPVTVTGIAKGAGMIRPDMATMLAFIATDAGVEQPLLKACLNEAVADSFNAITVDGDTSTNDACVLLATGLTTLRLTKQNADYDAFKALIYQVCSELAQAIVRDGEGATKFITVIVEQGKDSAECRRVAYTIAHSPLVKTAFFASDPNWGRILAAIGRSGLDDLDIQGVSIYLDDVCIVSQGERAVSYTEALGQQVMQRETITVRVLLGRGQAAARLWTTDLSFDYVRINAEYRS
ncbi:MAG: bifunctional glutamate N-acetyltransferase/amino-acid acetyltransferase ArgJ [Candidatus Competibacteraceae bacterium]|nr:bifunctional glutamate N-acetyltransferase/amino-acid acetyltransferase ArgJ [Candidatus Competibacteraceae bacterium]